jgi:FAD/FMN-containing dehydrogenase
VGNDGLTGVVTKIRIRLVPARERAFGIAYYHEPESVAKAVVRMYREKAPPPLFMEFMDKARPLSVSSTPACWHLRDVPYSSPPWEPPRRSRLRTRNAFSML